MSALRAHFSRGREKCGLKAMLYTLLLCVSMLYMCVKDVDIFALKYTQIPLPLKARSSTHR